MNPGIDYYMSSGLPALGKVTFLRGPNTQPPSSATLSVTVGSNTYTWQAPGSTTQQDFCGSTSVEMARNLAAAINAQQNRSDVTSNNTPIKSHYAMYYGSTVAVIATVPGVGGNTIALTAASSDAGCYSLSGATLTGGTAAGSASGSSTNRTGLIIAGNGGANNITQLSVTSKPFVRMFAYGIKTFTTQGSGQAVTAFNAATTYLGEKGVDGVTYFVDQIPTSGLPVYFEAPAGGQLDLMNFWFLAPTANDALFIKYI